MPVLFHCEFHRYFITAVVDVHTNWLMCYKFDYSITVFKVFNAIKYRYLYGDAES